MPDIPEDENCKEYMAKIERSIDNILKLNKELTNEKERLKERVAALTEENDIQRASIQELSRNLAEQKPALTFEQQYLIDICGQMAEAWRPRFDSLLVGLQEIIRAYDKIYPKEVEVNGQTDSPDSK